jgi:hypothetical protein
VEAVKLDPRLVEARINLGQLQEYGNQEAEAIGQYRNALQTAPGNVDAALFWWETENMHPLLLLGWLALENT